MSALPETAESLVDYEDAKKQAASDAVADRRDLASHPNVQPEILFFLSGDPDPAVRRAVAENDATPAHAGPVLAKDSDEDVRHSLAIRIAELAPELDEDEKDRIGGLVEETLELLVRDEIPRVRRALSEALKNTDAVPPHIIESLASDTDESVAMPVLEFSPLLEDDFLLEIISSDRMPAVLPAMARRSGLAAPVADALAATSDVDAIEALLRNESAQIREETLDMLADQAEQVPTWHEPLATRPELPPRAAARLADYVAHDILVTLQSRSDLTPEAADIVSQKLDEYLTGDSDAAEKADPKSALLDDLAHGDRDAVMASLAKMSGLEESLIDKVISMASAKGMISVAWRAGLSMSAAEELQLHLARVPPPKILEAEDDGGFPLTEDEMAWQLDFFGK